MHTVDRAPLRNFEDDARRNQRERFRCVEERFIRQLLRAGNARATVRASNDGGAEKRFDVQVRIDTPQEAEYYRNGGILPYVLRQLAAAPVSA